MGDHTPISLGRATKLLGFDGDDQGRALLRELEARERALGVQIVQRGKGPRKIHKRVTIAAIRKYAPDLVPSRADKMLLEVQSYLQDIDERVDQRVDERFETLYQHRIAPALLKLQGTQDRMAGELLRVTKVVDRLAPPKRPSLPQAVAAQESPGQRQ